MIRLVHEPIAGGKMVSQAFPMKSRDSASLSLFGMAGIRSSRNGYSGSPIVKAIMART
jgi:hypothetical protein